MKGTREDKVKRGGLGKGEKGDGSYIAWEAPASGEITCFVISYQNKKKNIVVPR